MEHLSTELQRWQACVRRSRNERTESETEVWRRLAPWYDDWARHNDYVSRALARIAAQVDANSRILEVGPGTGGFTLRLARLFKEVVAVEPSPDMRTVLERHLADAGIANVQLVAGRIEEALPDLAGPFELALASHSLYDVEPVDQVISGLMRVARHVAILMGTGDRPGWYDALYARFRGKTRIPAGGFREFYSVLMEMGVLADVEILSTRCNYVYDGEDAMLDWWQGELGLDASRRDELRAELTPRAERRGDRIGIYGISRSALMWIDRDRNRFSPG